ncbi:MAG TPA: hypothetical protein VE988_06080 [Gemmataceae bacterium]|nr:hypothetical protein [Gemmataceae bacterium]
MPYRGDDTDELDDREWPEPDHSDDPDGGVETLPCPFCKAPVYENTERCPHCENYLFYDGPSSPAKPLWFLAGVVICLGVVIYWIFRG